MADINLAGGFDPAKFKKIFGAELPGYQLNLQSAADPYTALYNKYKPFAEQRIKDLQQISGQDKSGLGLAVAAMNDPLNLMLQSELQGLAAEKANKMSRENLELAEKAAIRTQGRKFTFERLGSFLDSIPSAFNPIPFADRQDVVANIANITSPRNLSSPSNISPAGYSYAPTKYYS